MKTKIIAEAGLNHDGNFLKAKKLIDVAKNAKADFVKFQLYKSEEFLNSKLNLNYKKIAKKFSKRELKLSDWKKLNEYSKIKNIKFFFSVFDTYSLNILKKLRIKIVKIPSGEITNYKLLNEVAKMKLKVIISTGMATFKEIQNALKCLKGSDVVIMHCISEYPTLRSELNYINYLKKKFPKYKIGFSDHSKNIFWPAASLYHGATYVEKHFTLNKKVSIGDHHMSLEPNELKEMIKLIRETEKNLLEKRTKKISIKEQKLKILARKAIYLIKNKNIGERVTIGDIKFLRPQLGIKSEDFKLILNKKLTKKAKAFKPLNFNMFNK